MSFLSFQKIARVFVQLFEIKLKFGVWDISNHCLTILTTYLTTYNN